jgi:hypothetical protein
MIPAAIVSRDMTSVWGETTFLKMAGAVEKYSHSVLLTQDL